MKRAQAKQSGWWKGPRTRRLLGVALLLGLACFAVRRACTRGWANDGRPLSLPSIDAELFFLQVPALVRAGPDRLAVVRVGPRARFEPHTYQEQGLPQPIHIEAWAKALAAPVVFNAGQFDLRLHHLGWLKSRGRWLESQRKAAFQGLLVSGRLAGALGPGLARQNAIVDMVKDGPEAADAYANVLQSMMMLDAHAQPRVRDSDRSACRTVVAEDRSGRLLVLVSEGAITLHNFASWLPHSGLDIVRAMNLDGGAESQLAVQTATRQVILFGKYGHERMWSMRPSVPEAPLPAVVAVVPND